MWFFKCIYSADIKSQSKHCLKISTISVYLHKQSNIKSSWSSLDETPKVIQHIYMLTFLLFERSYTSTYLIISAVVCNVWSDAVVFIPVPLNAMTTTQPVCLSDTPPKYCVVASLETAHWPFKGHILVLECVFLLFDILALFYGKFYWNFAAVLNQLCLFSYQASVETMIGSDFFFVFFC